MALYTYNTDTNKTMFQKKKRWLWQESRDCKLWKQKAKDKWYTRETERKLQEELAEFGKGHEWMTETLARETVQNTDVENKIGAQIF